MQRRIYGKTFKKDSVRLMLESSDILNLVRKLGIKADLVEAIAFKAKKQGITTT